MVEEGVKTVVRRTERKPSVKEVEEHVVTHLPFRSWCPMCVQGKSKIDPHCARGDRDSEVQIVNADHMYMESAEEEHKMSMLILVIKDGDSRWIASRVTPKRGRKAHVVKELAGVIDIMMEESPDYDSRSNGEGERAAQTVQRQVRTVKSGPESRLGARIESVHPCLLWPVQHAVNLLSRYMKAEDGGAVHRRPRGREFGASAAEFGESVMYMKTDIIGKDKMDARWETGVWLGMREESNESIIGTRHGCIKVRSFKRKPESDR